MIKQTVVRFPKLAGLLGLSTLVVLSTAWLPLANGIASATPPPTHDISTCAQLMAMDDGNDMRGDTFRLTADIDCQMAYFHPLKWTEIDEEDEEQEVGFAGTFDGQGHTITNLYVNEVDLHIGLFSFLDGATVKDLTLEGVYYTGEGYAGALAASCEASTITGVVSHASITTDIGQAGGICGELTATNGDSLLKHSYTDADVTGSRYAGGLVGIAYAADGQTNTIEQVYATGNIAAASDVGGLVGQAEVRTSETPGAITIQDVYATGNATADNGYVGGLVGSVSISDEGAAAVVNISRAYASGTVTGDDNLGGLVGIAGNFYYSGTLNLANVFAATPLIYNGDPQYMATVVGQVVNGQNVTSTGVHYDHMRTNVAFLDCAEPTNLTSCIKQNHEGSDSEYFFGDDHAPYGTWDFEAIWQGHVDNFPTLRFGVADGGDGGDPDNGGDPDSGGGDNGGNNGGGDEGEVEGGQGQGSQDADGIADAIENAAPNSGDANSDGVKDNLQPNVASFVNPSNNKYATLAVDNACTVTSLTGKSAQQIGVKDSGFSYPYGLLDFRVSCGTPGYEATVTQFYYGADSGTYSVRKFTPATGAFSTIVGATYETAVIGGQGVVKATYQVKDGSPYDDDGSANGVIVDPAGLGVLAAGVPDTGLQPVREFLGL